MFGGTALSSFWCFLFCEGSLITVTLLTNLFLVPTGGGWEEVEHVLLLSALPFCFWAAILPLEGFSPYFSRPYSCVGRVPSSLGALT